MVKGAWIVLFSCIFFISCGNFSVTAAECVPAVYNFSNVPSDICDYGVNLSGFVNGNTPCKETKPSTYIDGVFVNATTCSDVYRKQQMTLNCIFALSNNSYEFNRNVITKDTSFRLAGGIGRFIINGETCDVLNAGYTYSSYYDCSTPLNTCHIPNSLAGTVILGNVSAKEYFTGFMVNMTCSGENKQYRWVTGYALLNHSTRDIKWNPVSESWAQAFFGYNRTRFVFNACGTPVDCFGDKDGDGYTNGTGIRVIDSACPSNFFNMSHFSDMNAVDCNDSNNKVWNPVGNLGLDMDGDGFVSDFSSCQLRCVGLQNAQGVYSNDSLNYIFSECVQTSAIDCNDNVFNLDNSCGNITGVSWLNLAGLPVSETNLGDTVSMSAQSSSLNFSQNNVNYSIYRAASRLFSVFGIVLSPTSSLQYWIANSAGNNTFFNASVNKSGVIYSNVSGYLNVSSSSANFAPVAVIDYPLDGMRISSGTNINFNQSSYDEDDVLNLTWNFGDGSSLVVDDYSLVRKLANNPSLGNAIHSYPAGTYTITLTAVEKERFGRDSQSISVQAFNPGINVIPVISSPPWDGTFGRLVLFDASGTYVVNCTVCSGDCYGSKDSGFYTDDGVLNCTYLHAPDSYRAQNLPSTYKLFFNWTMGDGTFRSGYWDNVSYVNLVEFRNLYMDEGKHVARLRVTYS